MQAGYQENGSIRRILWKELRWLRPPAPLVWIVLLILISGGCGAYQAADVQQKTRGRQVYQAHCARCHGDQGEGKRGPALIGPIHGLRGYETAQGLYNYTSIVMPYDAAGTLQSDEYWAVLAYILNSNQVLPPGIQLGPENAVTIRLDQQP